MIEVRELKKYFYKRGILSGEAGEPVRAVDGVSFSVPAGTTFGLVGESGSGKTTLAKLVTGILKPDSGQVIVNGDADMVFQDPYGSLNPRMRVMGIVGESLKVRGFSAREIEISVMDTLRLVNLPDPENLDKYPHEFSGGERQRVAIARAIIRRPALLVLDEPVSSLDVSIQAGILNLLKDLQERLHLTYLFISHDLRVVEFMSDTVGVMRDGKLVEVASRDDIYSSPKHEYTKQLLAAIPGL